MPVSFDPATRGFFLRLAGSYLAMEVADDGQLMHVGSGPLPADTPDDPGWLRLPADQFLWDHHCDRQELPAFGDVCYHDVALKVWAHLPGGQHPLRDVRLRYAGHRILQDAEPGLTAQHGIPPNLTTPRDTLEIHLHDPHLGFSVYACWRLTVDHDIIERWLRLENHGTAPLEIRSLAFGALYFPAARWVVTHAAGHWLREFLPVRHRLEQGTFRLDQRGLNTGHASSPAFFLEAEGTATEACGPVWFGALAYSGNWNIRFDALPTGSLRVFAGYETDDFSLTLAPGDGHTTPAFVQGCAADGRGGASRRLHRFTRERVLPGWNAGEERPVLFNSWEAANFAVSESGQIALARQAAELGVELFCLDDGWFGTRSDDTRGLGDWTARPAAFPRGLRPLRDEIHRLGMKFGLWVEPEMVNPDSDLYRAHPDWVLHFPGRPRSEFRHQLVLDFGRPEVVVHIRHCLDELVRANRVDFLKWDMNRYATEPGSVAGLSIWQAHVRGVYGIMDFLRRTHPGLSIQSCSGGGGRVDLGILARTDQVWTSDNTDAQDRTSIQDGFSLFYPPRTMEAWVTDEINGQTGRRASLDLRFDVAMRGTLGLGLSIDRVSPEEAAACRRKIAFYKTIRHVVQNGDLHRLAVTSQDDGLSVWLFVSPDRSQAVYSFVRLTHPQGRHLGPMRLRGLHPHGAYAVTDESGAGLGIYPASQLLALGLPGDDTLGGLGHAVRSRTLFLQHLAKP